MFYDVILTLAYPNILRAVTFLGAVEKAKYSQLLILL
jgi:hypothetical protein